MRKDSDFQSSSTGDTSETRVFLEAYEKYAESIYRHCYFRVFSKVRAEELMQETFLKTWDYVSIRGGEIENLRAFLYRVANNLIIDESRKKKESSLEAILEDHPEFEPAHVDDAQKNLMIKDVLQNLFVLSPEDRAIVTMRYIDELDPKEIAVVLGSNTNRISVRLNRALKTLRDNMK